MAITKKEIEALQCSDALKRRILKSRECCVTFANTDLLPTKCSWYLTIGEARNVVGDIAKAYLGDREIVYTDIRVEYSKSGGNAPMVYIWLRKDSKHLTDKSLQAPSSGVTVTGSKYSKELLDLVDLYAAEYDLYGNFIPRNKRVDIRNQAEQSRRGQESNIVALTLDLIKFFERLFDVTNAGFVEVYGQDAPTKAVSLEVFADRKKNKRDGDEGRRGDLRGFTIVKSYAVDRSRDAERPIPSFRDANFAKNGYEEEDPFRRERRKL